MIDMAVKFALAAGLAASMALEGTPEASTAGEGREVSITAKGTPHGSELAESTKSRPADPPLVAQPPAAPDPASSADLAAKAFAADVVRLSREADALDRLWLVYKTECGVRVGRQYAFGREWFALWDRAAQPTIDGRGCSEVLWRLLQGGDNVRRELGRARATAHAALDPGTEIGMLRWNSLEWPQLEDRASAR